MSLGRHDPPNAKPGRRYAGEMLSLVSLQKMSITAWLSMPLALQMLPTSLPKQTLSACQTLSTYFTNSLVSTDVRMRGALRPA